MLMARDGRYDDLMRADQLRACQASGEAFVGFQEGRYGFMPTFKVKRSGDCSGPRALASSCDPRPRPLTSL